MSFYPKALRAEPSPLTCYVGYHNVIVDTYGNVYACTVMYQNGRAVGNVREQPLPELWRSEAYQRHREELTGCKACFWNCHTELNLIYQGPQG